MLFVIYKADNTTISHTVTCERELNRSYHFHYGSCHVLKVEMGMSDFYRAAWNADAV